MKGKLKDNSLRNMEYFGALNVYSDLYLQSQNGKIFYDLISLITSEENIRLAYRNIKNNHGSRTCGVDKKTIKYIKKMKLKDFIKLIQNRVTS